ncbi:hypothetical protein 7t3_0310 [Salmonella phage 7t3]|nr:hypothetical protein 7t3_0310 [Salmonella phage 7t3]
MAELIEAILEFVVAILANTRNGGKWILIIIVLCLLIWFCTVLFWS